MPKAVEYKGGTRYEVELSSLDENYFPHLCIAPAEQREQAYNTDPCVPWDGSMLTVTEAAQLWQYYAAEGRTDKTDALTVLIAAAKAEIRAKYPDNAGGT